MGMIPFKGGKVLKCTSVHSKSDIFFPCCFFSVCFTEGSYFTLLFFVSISPIHYLYVLLYIENSYSLYLPI